MVRARRLDYSDTGNVYWKCMLEFKEGSCCHDCTRLFPCDRRMKFGRYGDREPNLTLLENHRRQVSKES